MKIVEFLSLRKATLVVLMAGALCVTAACSPGTAKVRQVMPSPSGVRYAVLLVKLGDATVGATSYLTISEGDKPQIGADLPTKGRCFVWIAYQVGIENIVWASESSIVITVEGSRSAYEGTIRLDQCNGVSAEWKYSRARAK